MAKAESTFKNMVLSLTLISLGASACLGFVYQMTKEPIELSVLNKKAFGNQRGCTRISIIILTKKCTGCRQEMETVSISILQKKTVYCRICCKYLYKKRLQRQYQSCWQDLNLMEQL